jgi:hypothetical protein
MTEDSDPLGDLSREQRAALVELAETYRSGDLPRRDVLRLAGAGALGGVLGGGAVSAARLAGTDPDSTPWLDGVCALFFDDVSSGPTDAEYGPDQAALFNANGTPYWRASGGEAVDLTAAGGPRSGSFVASPRGVQSTLDRAEAGGGGTVRLDPKRRYVQDGLFPWHVRSGVTLDFNGAVLYGSGTHADTDLIHVYPRAQVLNPRIDLWNEFDAYGHSNPFTGTVFTLDAKYGPYFADGTTIRGGYTQAVGTEGTWLRFAITAETPRVNHLTHVTVDSNFGVPPEPTDFDEQSFDIGVHLDSRGPTGAAKAGNPDGFLNGIRVEGNWQDAVTTVVQEGGNPNSKHLIDAMVQTPSDGDHVWHVKPDTVARETVMRGVVWDPDRLANPSSAWNIESDLHWPDWVACHTNHMDVVGVQPRHVTNRSPGDQYLTNAATNQTTIV